MWKILFLLGLLLIIGLGEIGLVNRLNPPLPTPGVVQATGTPLQPTITQKVAQLVLDVNRQREAAQETDLVEELKLDQSATNKCADMQTRNYFSHDSPTGESWVRFLPTPYTKAGENLAENLSYTNVTQAWMLSPLHRANILDRQFNHVGYAICGRFIVQHFEN